ncbi:TolA protein [Minicystis rosea]|nr:TolA protein [Minicystis rosea]
MSESFAAALRAELDAVVGRYEALVRALAEVSGRETDTLRAEVTRLSADNERLRSEASQLRAEAARIEARALAAEKRADDLAIDLSRAREKADREAQAAQAAHAATQAYEEQFAAERRFVEACRDTAGSLLGEAVATAAGRSLDATSATFAALKSKGLEAVLAATFKERGRSTAQAPLLERERAALPALAAAAGCELIAPPTGTRFSSATMERGASVTDPAEEGNVLDVAMPGLRRAGTDGALVFPRVVVATG